MKKLIILLTLLLPATSNASWYCDKVASEWTDQGKILKACGIGKGEDENSARIAAYNNARKEFDLVCNKDTSCANKVINIDPQRSECSEKDGEYVCHRLYYYHITNEDRRPDEIREGRKDPEPKIIKTKTEINNYHNTYNSYITVQPAVAVQAPSSPSLNSERGSSNPRPYRTFIRQSGRVSIYATNSRAYQGTYLTNPSEEEIERAITRGNRSGGVNAVYIYNP